MNILSIFNFWRKKQVVAEVSDEPVAMVPVDGMLCIDGFRCERCRGTMFENQTYCRGCKTPYSRRILEIAECRRKAKLRLAKIMGYDAMADVICKTTEKVAMNSALSPRVAFSEMLDFWGA